MATSPLEVPINEGADPGVPRSGTQHAPPTPYKYTTEELRVLRQCNKESFYQRSLPFAAVLGIGAYLGVQAGYFKGHKKYGPTLKVMGGAVIGYFLGKLSYQSKCAEKLMHLPNSPIGELLRRRKRGGQQETRGAEYVRTHEQGSGEIKTVLGKFVAALLIVNGVADMIRSSESEGQLGPGFSTGPALPSIGGAETYSDIGPQHDLDSGRPYMAGLDDSGRPTPDTIVLAEEDLPSPQSHSTTYEELRRKNREEYEQKKTKQFRGVAGQEDLPTVTRPRSQGTDTAPTPGGREKNQYGDVWDK
uniref:OCIA domain-containing protein n=1 Tax=Timema tahoe TaxID=61484 RepID=A0A7R9INZ0_9NEOP|nr:unnamed protein product [Timema tahoe]